MGFTIADAKHPHMPGVFTGDTFLKVAGHTLQWIVGYNSGVLRDGASSEQTRRDMAMAISRCESFEFDVLTHTKPGRKCASGSFST